MSSFTEPLIMEPLAKPSGGFKLFGYHFLGTTEWKLKHDFVYHVGDKSSPSRIGIKSGFKTDLASIPRSLWVVYPPYSPEYGKAAVLHDAIYASELFDRKTCDDIFYEAMGVLGAGPVSKRIIYTAVRTFGGFVWANHTAESVAEARKFVSKKGFITATGMR
jgi:hypothetical protein